MSQVHYSTPSAIALSALAISTFVGFAGADLVDGRVQVGAWDFSNEQAFDLVGNNQGDVWGRTEIGMFGGREAAGFLRGSSEDYIKFEDRDAYQLSDGVLAIDFKQTGHWNSMETLFSKDSNGYLDGGHLTVNLIENSENDHQGFIQVRLQSDKASYFVNSGMLDLNRWYNMEFAFGQEGMKLAVDGQIVDTNAYTGGLIGNYEEFSLGSSRWASRSGDWNNMRNGYSGYISSVGLYGATIPAPGALAILFAGGFIGTRRRR